MFPIRDHNPSEKTPYVTIALIVINVVVFLWQSVVGDAAIWRFGFFPVALTAGEDYYRLVTHMFLHGGLLHLGGNMLFLWIFGDNLEEEMGPLPFLGFYLLGGIAAALMQYAPDTLSRVPMIGASGAIAAVMGGYLLLFPRARVDVLIIIIVIIRIIPVPAFLMLGLWFVIQLFNGVAADLSGGGVAYWAHAGGFIAGFVLTVPLFLRRGATQFWSRTQGHPPHPETRYRLQQTNVPTVRRRRR